MKTNVFFNNFHIICLVLFISLIALSVPSSAEEYILYGGYNEKFSDHELNISAEEKISFRIWNNKTNEFVVTGTIKIDGKPINIKQQSKISDVLDSVAKWGEKYSIGDGTWGNNEDCYAENIFNETTETYSKVVTGYIGSNKTNNSLIINVKSKYNTIIIKNLNNRSLKYHNRYKQIIELLIGNINEFIDSKNQLQNKINTLNNPNKKQLDDLPVDKVIASKDKVMESIKTVKEDSDEELIKDQLFRQLDQIDSDTINITVELAGNLNAKKKDLLEKDKNDAINNENAKKTEFSDLKFTFQSEVFYPAGALVLLGLIIGYVNVSRWKKESEYLGLMTSNADITSPITIATIITLVILILIAVIVHQYGDFGMFSYLI